MAKIIIQDTKKAIEVHNHMHKHGIHHHAPELKWDGEFLTVDDTVFESGENQLEDKLKGFLGIRIKR